MSLRECSKAALARTTTSSSEMGVGASLLIASVGGDSLAVLGRVEWQSWWCAGEDSGHVRSKEHFFGQSRVPGGRLPLVPSAGCQEQTPTTTSETARHDNTNSLNLLTTDL
jgi:hypothetical protein